MVPVAINIHLTRACDSRCTFCFATFETIPRRLPTERVMGVIRSLRDAGAEKLNFAGGEPTLCDDLGDLLAYAKSLGFVTSIVTNGFRLDALLDEHARSLDWVGLSVDTNDEAVQRALGRGHGDHVERSVRLAARCRAEGVRVKLNTVVTAANAHHDLSELVRSIRPERWKVFQVLRIEGQNDGRVEQLLLDGSSFRAFLERHAHLGSEGYVLIAEDNDAMTDSYVMIDPLGRFFGNSGGRQSYSRPILSVGVDAALREIGFRSEKLEARGGRYAW